MRKIVLNDGTGMGGSAIIFETDAPVELLKELEKESCDVYKELGPDGYLEVPNWEDVCNEKGYTFKYVADHQHVTAYGSSKEWLEDNYSDVTETYTIEDQPNL